MHENILKLFFETLQMIHLKKFHVKRIELSILFLLVFIIGGQVIAKR